MLSDEEREALEILELYFGENSALNITKYVNIVLNLIKKQQKEIEELKKPKYLLNAKTGEITTINNSEFISKDKIKAKIEELEKLNEEATGNGYGFAIYYLSSLLEKE